MAVRVGRLAVRGISLTVRGWGFLSAGVLALLIAAGARHPELNPIGVLLIALPVLAVVYVVVRRPRLRIARGFVPALVTVGRPAVVRLSVRNVGATATAPVGWWDELPFPPHDTGERELPSTRPSAWPRELEIEVPTPRRGVFDVGPFVTVLRDPFQLATGLAAHGGRDELIVTPEAVPLPESGLSVPAGSGEARLVQRRASGDEDDAITREYRPGDAMRRVHWRATARHDELMVRQEEQRSLPQARIMVDTLAAGYPDVDDDGTSDAFEWTVRMLASVAVHLRRAGFAVTVLESGRRQLEVQSRRNAAAGDDELLSRLAPFELQDDRDEHTPRTSGAGPLIALAGDPDGATVDWMRRHRRAGGLAVAFLAQPVTAIDRLDRSLRTRASAGDGGERLLDDGWLVVPVRADDDHASAWSAVVVETGRARGA